MTGNDLGFAKAYESADEMKAIAMTDIPKIGKVAEYIKMIKVPVPRPQKDEVAIKMCASALYADEIYAAQGTALGRFFGPKLVSEAKPYIMGSSVSGIIVALGDEILTTSAGLYVGQEIISIPSPTPVHGVWAEYCCLKKERIIPKPDGFSFVEGAAIKMPACVSWGAISYGNIKPGDNTLVIGASGGVGIISVQYLKALGAKVTGVCSNSNAEMVRSYGADEVVDYTKNNFADVAEENNIRYDCILDCVGGMDAERDAFRVLKKSGKFITVTGPLRFIGEKKLSWLEVSKVVLHISYKSFFSGGIFGGPQYIFGEMNPTKAIDPAFSQLIKHKIRMPVSQTIPFKIDAVKEALNVVLSHRGTQGRMVIDFSKS